MTVKRVEKGGKRYYKTDKPLPPVAKLIPTAVKTFSLLFAPGGDDPSVTTILQALAKPALVGWAAKEERKMVAAMAARLYERLPLISDEPVPPAKFYDLLMEEAGKPANRRLVERAASVGTEVHNRIEWEFKGELELERSATPPPLSTPAAERAFTRWTEWRAQVQLKVLKTEYRLHSGMFGYGGTLDLLAQMTIPDPLDPAKTITVIVVLDFKTGKHIYSEAFLQNIAYRMALAEEGVHTDGGWIVRLPKYEDDPEFDAQPVPDDPLLAPVFLALGLVYRWWAKDHDTKRKPKTEPQQAAVVDTTPENVVKEGTDNGQPTA